MSTVDKALRVLDLFSENAPNLGLSEIARQLGWDKSNVQRYLSDLTRNGLLEQSTKDKTYYLGPSLVRLARLRELTHPVARVVHAALEELTDITGETTHCSTLVGGRLMNMGIVETRINGTRVYIDPTEALPFHASASGIAYLTAVPEALAVKLLGNKLDAFTPQTETRVDRILELVGEAKQRGYARSAGTFESDVVGIAAPIRGFRNEAIGAISVATPQARFSDTAEADMCKPLMDIAARVSRSYGA